MLAILKRRRNIDGGYDDTTYDGVYATAMILFLCPYDYLPRMPYHVFAATSPDANISRRIRDHLWEDTHC